MSLISLLIITASIFSHLTLVSCPNHDFTTSGNSIYRESVSFLFLSHVFFLFSLLSVGRRTQCKVMPSRPCPTPRQTCDVNVMGWAADMM